MTTLSSFRASGPTPSCSAKFRGFLSLVCALAFSLFALDAHAQETGTVTGRVLNAANGMYLGKALVIVDGTSIEALTDDSGSYILRNVPAGAQQLTVTFTGQAPVTVTVEVPAGGSLDRTLVFNRPPDASEDEDLVVLNPYVVNEARFKNAQELAAQEERYSINIKNVISADAFGDIPSGNIGEFVRFMPGVLVDYGSSGGSNQGTADNDATGISVRGFEAADTAITIDGMPVTNAFPGSLSRQTYLDTMSINNASRVELTKVPTPDMPANSVGGQVNLITRSAFEFAKPSINFSAYATANNDHFSLSKTPGPINKRTHKIQPAGTVSVTYPFTPNFGISVSGSYVPQFKSNRRATPTYSVNNPGGLGALTQEQAIAAYETAWTNTYRLERFQITETPQMTTRTSGNLKLDWKPFPGHTLSGNIQASTYDSEEAARRLQYRTGAAVSWTEDAVIGQINNNAPRVAMTVTTRDRTGDSTSGYLTYKLRLGGWELDATANRSVSNSEYADLQNGHFSEVGAVFGAQTANQVQVNFHDIRRGIPNRIEVRGGGGSGPTLRPMLLSSGWRFDGDSAKSGESFSKDTNDLWKIDLKRNLDFFPGADRLNMALKVGFRRDVKHIEKWGRGSGYAEEIIPGKSVNFADLIDDTYLGQSPGWNFPAQEWVSSYKAYDLDQELDLFDVLSEGRRISNYNSFANQNKSIKETRDAMYFQINGSLFNGRLKWLGGMRQEEQERTGRGPYTDNRWNFIKNPDGTVYREDAFPNGVAFNNANSALFSDAALRGRIDALGLWYPTNDNGTPRILTNTTLEGRMLQLVSNRAVNQKAKGDPSYSINLQYDITKDLVAKLAWSRTFRQPPLENSGTNDSGLLSGNNYFTFNEFSTEDANGMIGDIRLANLALEPETANNWDAALSYYFGNGGKVTVSYYWKEITNQILTFRTYSTSSVFDTVLLSAGYDPDEYRFYYLTTSTNGVGGQTTDGYEIEVQQNLGILGNWGRGINVFTSYTKKNLGDPPVLKPVTVTRPDGTTQDITPTGRTINLSADEFAGAGINFSSKRFSATVRGTYRSRNQSGITTISYTPTGGTQTPLNYLREFEPSEVRVDANLDYRLSEKYSVFVNAKDFMSRSRHVYQQDDLGWLPSRARWVDHRKFGMEVTFGVRGTF